MKYSIKELITDKISGEWGDESINGGGYKVLRTTNFTNLGKINFENVVERNIDEKKVNQKHLKNGDLIIEKSGGSPTQPVGRVVFFDLNTTEKYLCNNFTAILRPNNDLVYSKYLFYQLHLLHTRGRTLKYQNRTTGIINLKLDNYLEEEIEVPQISDQLNIANILTKAENLIAKRKESIQLLDEFLKSTFLEMFGDPVRNEKGWEINSLAKFGSLKNGLNYTRNESGMSVRCLGVGDFRDLSKLTDIESLPFLNLTSAPSDNYYLKDGDLVFVRSNGNRELVGRCILVLPKSEKVTYSGFCIRYRIEKGGINPIFLAHLFRVPIFRKSMLQGGRGANIQNINQQTLEGLKITVPPIDFQTQFAQIVEKTETLKIQYQQGLKELENLYGSLSQRAFRGELRFKEEGLMIAAEPKVPYIITQSSIPDRKRGFAKQVLGGKIVSLFKDDKDFSHIKFQKLQYLAEHFASEDLLWNYYRQSAGPYDNKFMHNVANKLKQNKWFEEKNFRFYPLAKAKDIDWYYKKYFGNKNELLNKLFSLLKNSSEKFCEAVATIYAVWNNHIILKQDFNVERIKQDFFEWSKRKTNVFTEDEFEKALQWMQKHEIVPTGFGQVIKERK